MIDLITGEDGLIESVQDSITAGAGPVLLVVGGLMALGVVIALIKRFVPGA